MTMVRWTLLLLAVVSSYEVQCIQVKVESNYFSNATEQLQNATNILGDSDISASERNRRLIPYMAFYVPASDLPINEKYLAQKPNRLLSGENQNSQTSEGHIPVPPTYMHLKAPEPSDADLAYLNNYNQQKLANHPYHSTIVYHDSNPEKDVNKKLAPVYQLLPPSPAPTATAMILPPAYVPHKHKTIQHFPPTTAETRYQQTAPQSHPQQPQQSVIYRERPKQSKNSFTPFTESNTLPGHFVPIIYTNKHNNNDDEDFKPGTTQEQTRFKNVPQNLPQKQIDTNDYILQQHPQQHELQPAHEQEPHIYLTVTASPAPLTGETVPAEHQTASPIYQLTNQAVQQQQQQQQQHQTKTFHSSLKLQQQQHNNHHSQHHHHQQHRQPATHHRHFQSMKIENLYAQQNDAQLPQQYLNGDFVTTPQEKYVVYLQQPVHVNRPQQQHNLQASPSVNGNRQQQHNHQQKEIIYTKEQRDHTKQQYVKQHRFSHPIFVRSTPTTPQNHESPEEIHINYGQQQPPVRHATYQPRPELLLTPPQQQQQQPASHIVYTQKQQQHLQHLRQQKQQKESQTTNEEIYFNIPVRNMMENIASNHHHTHHHPHSQQQLAHSQNLPLTHSSPLAPHYIEYVIDEPKQSLDEETHQTAYPPQVQTSSEPTTTPDSRDSYILVTTPAPSSYRTSQMHRPEHHYGSTIRPVHKERKPTLRLQPIEQSASVGYFPKYTTMQPKPFKTQQQNQAKYVYVSTKPTYTQLLYAKPTMAIKVKPDYAYVTPNTIEDQTPKEDTQLSKEYSVDTKVETAENELPDIRSSSLEEILHKLQASNHLPHTLTPENIDNSIKTLITILNNLKNTQSIVPSPPLQHHEHTQSHKYNDDDYTTGSDEVLPPATDNLNSLGPNKHPGPSTGRAGVDFPNYSTIPQTSFDCHTQRYKGFFGDPETNCQVWHYCDLNGGKASFLCPNGTIFSQIALTCDWWFNVKCSTTTQLYVLNERLYKYILPFTPKFPEDYSGPLVDKYLAMKYQEMEEKMRAEKSKSAEKMNEVENSANTDKDESVAEVTTPHSVQMKHEEPNIQHNLVNDADADADTDDISNRGTIDTYEISTQRQPETVTAADEMPPLSVKPIVVSSTLEPAYETVMYHASQAEQNTSSSSVEEMQLANKQDTANLQRPLTNITVEKVEVIEIKTDGTSGHLAPENQTDNK